MLLVSCPAPQSMKFCPPTCVDGSTWFWCGWRVTEDGARLNGLEFLNASTGVACPRERRIDALGPLSMIMVPVSVCLPPTSPFPRTTVHVPITSLLTEECFRGLPARPQPAVPPGIGLPVGLLNASRSPFRVLPIT